MFLVKRIIGVPGYQYIVPTVKKKICSQIYSSEELSALRDVFRTMYKDKKDLVEMYDILFDDGIPLIANSERISSDAIALNKNSERSECIVVGDKKFNWIMRSKGSSDWQYYLHEAEFSVLGKWDRFVVFFVLFNFRVLRVFCWTIFLRKGF